MNRRTAIAMAVSAAVTMLLTPARAQVAGGDADIAIVGATVHTEPGTVIDNATVIIRDGLVNRIARGLEPRARRGHPLRIIDGKDKIVTAGLVESHSRIGIAGVPEEKATRDGDFAGGKGADVIRAAYRVRDGYNPTSVAIPVARAGGVTAVVSVPRGGLVAGRSGWFSLADGSPRDVIVRAPAAMHASLGVAALDSAEGSRGLAVLRLREVLDDARIYQRQRRSYDRNQSRALAAGRLDLEALGPGLRGRIPLVVDANRSTDILAAVALGRDLGVRIIIAGGAEAWMIAKKLASEKVGVIIDPADNLPKSFDQLHVRDDAPKLLAEAGVAVAISNLGEAADARNLRQYAGMAVANGMSWNSALAAITTVPAQLFGVPRGKLAPGAVADLVVWSGDPFELSTRAEHVIIAGVDQDLRTRQTLLFERYRKLPPRRH